MYIESNEDRRQPMYPILIHLDNKRAQCEENTQNDKL